MINEYKEDKEEILGIIVYIESLIQSGGEIADNDIDVLNNCIVYLKKLYDMDNCVDNGMHDKNIEIETLKDIIKMLFKKENDWED